MKRRKRDPEPTSPLATIAFYGPNDKFATKVVVGIVRKPDGDVSALERWCSEGDIREDENVFAQVRAFADEHGVGEVITNEEILGCPHEEGIDYPEDDSCPKCPFWRAVDHLELLEDIDAGFSETPARATSPKIGRNEACPCGSGRKFKKCCLVNQGGSEGSPDEMSKVAEP